MPILWHSSFNGMEAFTSGMNTRLWTGLQQTAAQPLGADNIINRVFGRGIADKGGINTGTCPMICAYGMKASPTASYTASCGLGVGKSSFDPTSNALIGSLINGSNDHRFGVYFNLINMIPYMSSTSYRVGFRIGVPAAYSAQTTYESQLGPVDMNHNGDRSAVNSWWRTLLFVQNKGREFYVEYEWNFATKQITIFVDDEQVAQVNNTGSHLGGWGFVLSHIFYGASGTSTQTMFEMRDMYIQTILSPADKRLGSATSVRQVALLGDDSVNFERPAGYDSNAAVASKTLRNYSTGSSEPGNGGLLGATAVGQQDLYNLDPASIASSLSAVEAVQVRTMASNRGSGVRNFGAIAKSGTVQIEPTTPGSAPTSQESAFNTIILTSDPKDDQRWDMSRLGALKVGSKLIP